MEKLEKLEKKVEKIVVPIKEEKEPDPGLKKERFAITCSNCGKPGEVPFQPDPNRSVYCNTCHELKKNRQQTENPVAKIINPEKPDKNLTSVNFTSLKELIKDATKETNEISGN